MGTREEKISGFFEFLKSRGFVEGEDYGMAPEGSGKFFLSEKARGIVDTPLGQEWLDNKDRFTIPMVDVENSPEPIKSILLECLKSISEYADSKDVKYELLFDILSGVVVLHQESWSAEHYQRWCAKLIRFHRVRATEFPALYYWVNNLFDSKRAI